MDYRKKKNLIFRREYSTNLNLLEKASVFVLLFTYFFITNIAGNTLAGRGNTLKSTLETTYINTDREIYIAGDVLFFKLFVVNELSLKLSQKSKIAYCCLRNSNKHNILNFQVILTEGMANGSIYLPDTLSTGYYQFISFTNCMRNEDGRDYNGRELFIANRFDQNLLKITDTRPNFTSNNSLQLNHDSGLYKCTAQETFLSITTKKGKYGNREKVILSAKVSGVEASVLTTLSFSVFEESPQTLNQICIKNHEKDTELVKQNNIFNCNYLPETKGQILQGKVISDIGNQPLMNSIVFLSARDTFVNLQCTNTDSSGQFKFLLNNYYDKKEINIKIKNESDKNNYHIVYDDRYLLKSDFSPILLHDTPENRTFILKSQNILKINKTYQNKLIKEDSLRIFTLDIHLLSPRLYEKPSSIVRPSDFEVLPDFFDIATELLPSIRIKKKNEKYTCNMINYSLKTHFPGNPAIFVDGIFIEDINQILNFNSNQISRIECVNTSRIIGNILFDGILAIFTKNQELSNIRNKNNFIVPDVNTIVAKSFNGPQYNGQEVKYMPDFRQLLYWNPNIQLSGNSEKEISFFTSDNTGSFIVNAQGITSDGKIVKASTRIIVEALKK